VSITEVREGLGVVSRTAYSLLFDWQGSGYNSELDLLFQLNMQLVKVNSKVVRSRGSEVSFWVDGDVWVVSFGALL